MDSVRHPPKGKTTDLKLGPEENVSLMRLTGKQTLPRRGKSANEQHFRMRVAG